MFVQVLSSHSKLSQMADFAYLRVIEICHNFSIKVLYDKCDIFLTNKVI